MLNYLLVPTSPHRDRAGLGAVMCVYTFRRLQCNEIAATSRRVREWKVTNGFCMSVRTYQSDSHMAIFTKFGIWDLRILKSVDVLRLRLSLDKKQTLNMKTNAPLWSINIIGLQNWDCVPLWGAPQVDESVFRGVRKTGKVTITSSCLSVRPSAWNNSAPNWRIFMKIWNLMIFRKSVEKIRVSLKSNNNKDRYTFFNHISLFSS
jgi:hypothetical protein